MRTVEIGGCLVEVDVHGSGDPVLFVHARPFARWYAPRVAELDDHTTIVYRRPVENTESFSIEGDAALVTGLPANLRSTGRTSSDTPTAGCWRSTWPASARSSRVHWPCSSRQRRDFSSLRAAIRWTFGAGDAAGVDVTVRNVMRDNSEPRFAESAAIIHEWFPAAAPETVPDATHLLVAQAAHAIARHLRQHWRER